MPDIDEIVRVKEAVADELFRIPGVNGVGVGLKIVGGEITEELAISVSVESKRDVPPEQMIPSEIQGFKTDVIQSRPVLCAGNDTRRYNPLYGGCQLSMAGGVWPTLGCIVKLSIPGLPDRAALTTVHGQRRIGDPVYQGSATIGKIHDLAYDDKIDACIVPIEFNPPLNITSACAVLEIGRLRDLLYAPLGMKVKKRGWASGMTYGTVTGIKQDQDIHNPSTGRPKRFKALTVVKSSTQGVPMLINGDSGSILVSQVLSAKYASGMLIAGDDEFGWATPMNRIMRRFNITLCTE